MSTCSNCGALFSPDDTECPECGDIDRSNPRNQVDSRSTDSEVHEETANHREGSEVNRESAADERSSGQDDPSVRASETEENEKLDRTTRTRIAETDVSETSNQETKSSYDDEPQSAQIPTSQDGEHIEFSETRPARDRKTENIENDSEGPAATVENELETQAEVLPPAYGSVALAAAEEMERTAGANQLQEAVDESEPQDSQSDSDAQQEGEAETDVAQTDEEHQQEKHQSTSGSDSVPPPKDEVAEDSPLPVRPPVLASEALREQIAPTEPGRNTIRILSVLVGIFGTVTMLLLLGTNGMGLPLAGAFLALTAFALPSIPYAPRAAAVFIISASTLGVVTWMYVGSIGSSAEVVETVGVVTLGTALQYRAWHRASLAARFLVAIGILICIGWLGMSGWLKDFSTLDPAWQSWLPTIIRAPFGLLLILSLLAFMDARSTGGCGIWAIALLVWHALHTTVQLMILVWPKESRVPNWQILSDELSMITAASIASPLLTVLVIFGVAQLLAVALSVDGLAKE